MKRVVQKLKTKTFKRLALAVVLVVLVAVAVMPLVPTTAEAQGESVLAAVPGAGAISLASSFAKLFGVNVDPMQWMLSKMVNIVLSLTAWLVWIAGTIFNYSVDKTLNMSGLLANIPVVDIGWRIIRDIANIVFIFIALWSGISITLGLQAEKAWGLLAHMVLVALFINFSLFITKTIVDGTNIAALHFYNLMKDPTSTTDADAGISGAFMKGLKLQTLYNSKTLGNNEKSDLARSILNKGVSQKQTQVSEWNIILVGVFGSVFLVITAFVFFAAAFLFIIRAITLIMLMVLSPLAFVAWILPGASGLASKWWSTLWSQAFFAPIYMALAYVVVATINSPGFGEYVKGATFAAAFTSTSGGVHTALIFNFLILIGLMLGCLIVAQSLGGKGAELGMKWAKGVSKFGAGVVGGMALGAGGMLARTGLRGGEALASTDYMKKRYKDRPEVLAKMKKWSVRSLDERWRETGSIFGGKEGSIRHGIGSLLGGQSAVGKFLQERTTGKLVEAKIAGKSIQEAHLESKEMETKRHDIKLRDHALKSGAEMSALTPEMQEKQRREELLKDVKDNAHVIVDNFNDFVKKYNERRAAGVPPTIEEEHLKREMEEKHKLATEYLASPDKLNGELKTLDTRLAELAAQYKRAQGELESALSRMSTEGFLSMPNEHFFNKNLMDVRVLGLDKYMALMHSEGILSHEEKEKVNDARYGEMHEESGRVDKSVKEWYDRQPYYLKLNEKHQQDLKDYEEKNKKWGKDNADYVTAQQRYETQKGEREETIQGRTELERRYNEEKQSYERRKTEYLAKGGSERMMSTAIGRAPEPPALPEVPPEPKAPTPPHTPRPTAPTPPNIPGMPGFQGEFRRTLRNMLNLEEFEYINEFKPDLFESKHWTATIRQGLINRIRESKNFTNQEKEQRREDKSYPIRMMSDNIIGEDFYEMEALPAAEKEKKRKDIEKEFRQDPKAFLDKLRQDPKKLERHKVGMWRLAEMIGGKNQDEVGMMPGRYLFNPEVAMLIDRGKANSSNMRGKDEGEKVELLEIVLPFEDAFRRGEIGKEYFTDAMQDFLDWWRHNTRGQEWYSQSVELPIHKNIYAKQPDGTLKVVESKVIKNVTRDTNDPGAGYRWVNRPGKGIQKEKMVEKLKLDEILKDPENLKLDDDEFEERFNFKPPWSA